MLQLNPDCELSLLSISFNELSVVVFFSLNGKSHLFVADRISLALQFLHYLQPTTMKCNDLKPKRILACVMGKNRTTMNDMSHQKSLILYVFCFSPWKNCLCANKWLNVLPLTEMMSKSCKNNFRKLLSNAAIKTNILYIFPRLNQRINLVCKYDMATSESENKPGLQVRYWVLWWKWTEKICDMHDSFKICCLIGKQTFSPWI